MDMANDKGYNGWSNYETWNVKLWIDNDQGSYELWRERTQECWEANGHDKEDTINELARCLKEDHQENMPEVQGTYADLLGAALSEVDWYEIAEAMVNDEDFAEEETETETEEKES
jgi:hypothetical protein